MKVAILTTIQHSMFSGGLANTTIALNDILKILGHDITILTTGKALWYDDCKVLEKNINVKQILKGTVFDGLFDLMIELVPYFENGEERASYSHNNVYFYRKNILIPTIEHSLYPVIMEKINYDGITQVWCFDLLCNNDEKQMLEVITRKPVIQLPYIWTPSIIESYRVEKNLPLWLQGSTNTTQWLPTICETNITSSSSCTIPLVIMRQAKIEQFPFSNYRVQNTDQLKKSQFFQDNIVKHCGIEDLSGEFVGRQRLIDMVHQPFSCIVSHVRFVPFKPYLFDLAWFGIPFIHNSEFLKNISCFERYYYPNNNISSAVEKLKLFPKDFEEKKGWFSLENIQKSRTQILERFTFLNPHIQEFYKRTLDTLKTDRVKVKVDTIQKKSYVLMFTDMWDDFNPTYNFFTLMLNSIHKDIDIIFCGENGLQPDAILFGPFGEAWKKYPGIPKIHFTGENTEPVNDESVKLNLGFQHADMVGENYLRFPLWLLEIDWFHCDMNRIVNPKPIPLERCTNTNVNHNELKKKFCCFVVSNPTNSIRNKAFEWLNEYKPIDSAGRVYNTMGEGLFAGRGGGGGELQKFEFYKDYKFCITYENNSSQGYVTEKLLHAKAAGCIPIYWGDPKVERDFDINGCIDARNIRTKEELIEAVKYIDENPDEYMKKFSIPALDDYRVAWAKRTMAECASRILKILTNSSVESKRRISQIPLVVTFATRAYLPSLQQWLASFDAQRKVMVDLEALVYLGDDVDDVVKEKILETYPFVRYSFLPKEVPSDFPDIWNPQHFAWKLYIYKELAKMNDRLIFYSDAGTFLCRWPTEYLRLVEEYDICVLEDETQINEQWCHETCVKKMKITQHELKQNQIDAGRLCFRGSEKTRAFFNEAWSYALKDVIVGEKWSGVRNGKHYGHRHDQSILSILSLRHSLPTYPLYNVYCDTSLRKTFLTNKSLYVHRGNFIIHNQFLDGIDDCFVINLKRRKDRLDKLYQSSPEFKRTIIEIEAYEGKDLILTPSLKRLFKPNDFHWKKAVMGCALSHLKLWHQLANEKPDIHTYLILEDDVKFVKGWKQRWIEALPHVPNNCDVIYLGGILPPNREGFEAMKEKVNPYFSRVKENKIFGQESPSRYFHFCAYSYILTKQGAQKILAMLQAKDGYFTSADHMICNLVNFLDIYFLDPLVSGCYQDDDPKYANSEFNNFNRIDNFDSDLWNNDERFTTQELDAIIMDDTIDIEKVLNEKSHTKKEVLNTKKPTIFRRMCILENQLAWKDLYEHKWLYEMFSKPNVLELTILKDGMVPVEKPIFLVQAQFIETYRKFFSWYEERGLPYYILHLSDEYGRDPIDFYENKCCLGVIRNYIRPNLSSKVLVLPLGYHYTIHDGIENPLEKTPQLPFRSLLWSFFGTAWGNREKLLEPLKSLEPNKYTFYENWNDPKNLGEKEYTSILLDSIFVPCMKGNNIDTFRLYEALECGCIPILVNEDPLFFTFISQYIPFLHIENWDQVPYVIHLLISKKESLEIYRTSVLTKYSEMKRLFKQNIATILV